MKPPPMTIGDRLDTSGVVEHWQENRLGVKVGPTYWSDLSPFEQGYVEAMFAGGVACEWCSGRGEVGGWVGQTAESGGYDTMPCQCLKLGFSDLAPATLETIRKDCGTLKKLNPESAPDLVWACRQAGAWTDFPPLTVSLNNAGKVVFGE